MRSLSESAGTRYPNPRSHETRAVAHRVGDRSDPCRRRPALGFVAVVSSNRSSRRENAAQAVIGAPYETESYGDQLLTGVLAGTAICAFLVGVILLVYVGVRKIRHSRT